MAIHTNLKKPKLEIKGKEIELKKWGVTVMRFRDEDVHGDLENVLRGIELYIVDYVKHTPACRQA